MQSCRAKEKWQFPAFTACPWHAATRSVTQIARQRAPFLHRRRHTPFYPRPPCSDGGGGSGEEEQQVVAARQRLPSADGGADEQISLAFKAAARPPSSVSLSLSSPHRRTLQLGSHRLDVKLC